MASRGPARPVALWPVPGKALLRVDAPEPYLVLADLHLGQAYPDARGPRPEVGSAEALATELIASARTTGARHVLLVGDVKEPIRGTPRHVREEVREFFGRLDEAGLTAEVVLGNHDVGLPSMLPSGIRVHPAGGVLRDGVGFFHGHSWPSRALLMQARTLVAGHLHPGFRLAPSSDRAVTGKERCWLRCEMRPLTLAERRRKRKHPHPRASTFLVLPTFNPLCANTALNRESPGRGRRFLLRRFLSRGDCRAFLLDGTDLGPIRWEEPSPSLPRSARPG